MIENKEVLSVAEISEYVDKKDESNSEILGFIKKFAKLDLKKAKELREKLVGLDLMKMNEKHIAKIIDLLPENTDELNKIFSDVGLIEEEQTKILNIVKEFQ